MDEHELFERFIKLYSGLDRAYGKYVLDENVIASESGKLKGHGVTVREDLLADQYTAHLKGEDMLGVVPIQDGNLVGFSAIDIDDYQLDIRGTLKRVKELKLPLVATRSKSGGMHLWLFFSIPVPARAAMVKLEEIADALGFPGIEVFPKQHQIGPDDVGNWINLPWYNAAETDRYGWTDDCEEMTDLAEWVEYAESRAITLKDLNRLSVSEAAPTGDRPFSDGPPCLQTIAERGVPEGQRNNTMFPMAVYAHAKHGDSNVEQLQALHDFNDTFFDPRMPDGEIETLRQQVEANNYRYPCLQAPIKDVCNRQLCLRRKYGVRLNGETFNFGTLWQIIPVTIEGDELYDECHWKLQINRNEDQYMLDFTTDELLQVRMVRKRAVNRRIPLPNFDNNDWNNLIEEKMLSCEIVHIPEDLSSVGLLRAHIAHFLSVYATGTESKLEINHGKAWHDEESDMYWFKGEVFSGYLLQQRYSDHKGSKLTSLLKDQFGFKMGRRRIDEEPTRVWMCPTRLKIRKELKDAPGFEETF